MKLAWLTDLHLNFVLDSEQIAELARAIESERPDAVLISGDIAEAPDFSDYLTHLSSFISATIYFVLGNHDYYRGSIELVRDRARAITSNSERIRWLPACGVVQLSSETSLVGHGGWGDARVGEFLKSDVILNDYLLIDELQALHEFPEEATVLTPDLMEKLQQLGDEAADHFRLVVPTALACSRHVVVLTHVPPFHEACWHEGNLSDMNWAPHFVCQAAGEALKDLMAAQPDRRMTVLCGHTHSGGRAKILDNLEVLTGSAVYRLPEIQQFIAVD